MEKHVHHPQCVPDASCIKRIRSGFIAGPHPHLQLTSFMLSCLPFALLSSLLIGAYGSPFHDIFKGPQSILDQFSSQANPNVQDADPATLPGNFKWEGSWFYGSNFYGHDASAGWDNVMDSEVFICPEASWISHLWVNTGAKTGANFVTGLHFKCNDPAASESHIGQSDNVGYVDKRAPHLTYYPVLSIRSGKYIDKVENVGFDGGNGPFRLGGNSNFCALVGFRAWIYNGFPQRLAGAFRCNNL